jgi:hypothetical protein
MVVPDLILIAKRWGASSGHIDIELILASQPLVNLISLYSTRVFPPAAGFRRLRLVHESGANGPSNGQALHAPAFDCSRLNGYLANWLNKERRRAIYC